MEHLLLPPGESHDQISYAAKESDFYDGKGFSDYPARQGYTNADLDGENDYGSRRPEDVERFFQSWLFFGLAIEFFAAFGVTVTTEHFLVPNPSERQPRIVNTSCLPDLLVQLKASPKSHARDTQGPAKKVTEILNLAQSTLDRFCTHCSSTSLKTCVISAQTPPPTWPVNAHASMSIMALCATFRLAARDILDMIRLPVHKGVATSSLLRTRLEQKWCAYDVAVMMDAFQADGHYYMSHAPSPGTPYLRAHANCTERGCVFVMDEENYVTQHAAGCHRTDCRTRIEWGGQLGPERTMHSWIDAVCQIIDRGATPFALWVKQYRKTWSVEYHTTGKRKPPYVAISHIWSDGLGNPTENSLPECQLERIQSMVDSLEYSDRKAETGVKTTGFWMDTLCVPVDNSLKEYRKKSIANMRHIYSNAVAVLVLDNWLLQIPSTNAAPALLSRLCQSAWLRRLWTHQEGFLAKNVYFQFQDRALHIRDIEDRRSEYEESLKARGVYSAFISDAEIQATEPYTFLKTAIQYDDGGDKTALEDAFEPLVLSLELRRTTRAADETLCLSSILGLDVGTYLAVSGPEAADRRMVQFYKDIRRFEQGIVFNTYARLPVSGFRWAPKSLIGHRSSELIHRLEDDRERLDLAPLTQVSGQWGLVVNFPGVMFQFKSAGRALFPSAGQTESFAIPLSNKSKTLNQTPRVFSLGKRLLPLPFFNRPGLNDLTSDGHFAVNLFPDSNGIQWQHDHSYGLILARQLDPDTEMGKEKPKTRESDVVAILGSVTANFAGGKDHLFEYLCNAVVSKRSGPPPGNVFEAVDAEVLGRETGWLVA